MQRTIKFRGLDLTKQWRYGIPDFQPNGYCEIISRYADGFAKAVVRPKTVGQFTGLVDKHGTEIYEGDILESEVHKAHYVGFCDGGFELIEPNEERLGLGRLSIYAQHMQVIGNIHEQAQMKSNK